MVIDFSIRVRIWWFIMRNRFILGILSLSLSIYSLVAYLRLPNYTRALGGSSFEHIIADIFELLGYNAMSSHNIALYVSLTGFPPNFRKLLFFIFLSIAIYIFIPLYKKKELNLLNNLQELQKDNSLKTSNQSDAEHITTENNTLSKTNTNKVVYLLSLAILFICLSLLNLNQIEKNLVQNLVQNFFYSTVGGYFIYIFVIYINISYHIFTFALIFGLFGILDAGIQGFIEDFILAIAVLFIFFAIETIAALLGSGILLKDKNPLIGKNPYKF